MSGFDIGSIFRTVLEKAGIGAAFGLIGLFVLAYFFREVLILMRDYTISKGKDSQELLGFIKMTQSRLESNQNAYMEHSNSMTKVLESLTDRIEEGNRHGDSRHAEIMHNFELLKSEHDEITKDILRSKGT